MQKQTAPSSFAVSFQLIPDYMHITWGLLNSAKAHDAKLCEVNIMEKMYSKFGKLFYLEDDYDSQDSESYALNEAAMKVIFILFVVYVKDTLKILISAITFNVF